MFIRNKSTARVALRRLPLPDGATLATIVTQRQYGASMQWHSDDAGEKATPETAGRVLWKGTSVTASGPVHLDAVGSRQVSLVVGRRSEHLMVHGRRVWIRRGRDLEASPPSADGAIEMAFQNAFGGRYLQPPGPDPRTGLPRPGGWVEHDTNPLGIGFYASRGSAEGMPLPHIEDALHPVRAWTDRPLPSCLASCPPLHALRLSTCARAAADSDQTPGPLQTALFAQHPGSGRAVHPWLAVGTTIELRGVGRRSVRFAVPGPDCDVVFRGRVRSTATRLRWIHIDAHQDRISVVYQHAAIYGTDGAPTIATVTDHGRSQ